MAETIVGSAIGTILGIIIVVGIWYILDWWFDARDTNLPGDGHL